MAESVQSLKEILSLVVRSEPIPRSLVLEITDEEVLRSLQAFAAKQGAGLYNSKTRADVTMALALTERLLDLDAKNPFEHLSYLGRDRPTVSQLNELPEAVARKVFEHYRGDIVAVGDIPEFMNASEALIEINKVLVKKSNGSPFTVPTLVNLYVTRYGLDEAMVKFIEANYKKVALIAAHLATVTTNEKILSHILVHGLSEQVFFNPSLTEELVMKHLLTLTPLELAAFRDEYKDLGNFNGLFWELKECSAESLPGEASIETLDELKREKAYAKRYARSGWTFGNPKPQVELIQARINAHEVNYGNLVSRAALAQSNADRGKVTQEYATKVKSELEQTEVYRKGLGMQKFLKESLTA